jgi:hypothetical protein
VTHGAGREQVESIQAGTDTRSSVRQKLGQPNVLELEAVYAWDWRVNRGTILLLLPGGQELPLRGASFRILARFQGDRVSAVERMDGTFPEGTPGSKPRHGRSAVAQEFRARRLLEVAGQRFELDEAGNLQWFPTTAPAAGRQIGRLAPTYGWWTRQIGPQNLAASPDGRFVVVVRWDSAWVWDLERQTVAADLDHQPDPAQRDNIIHRAFSGFLPVLFGHEPWYPAAHAVFSEDGRRLLLVFPWGLRMVDTATWKPMWSRMMPIRRHAGLISKDGSRVVLPGDRLEILDGASGQLLGAIEPRAIDRWGSERDLVWGLDFQVDWLSPTTIRALGPATDEQWDLAAVEQAFRESGHPARVSRDAPAPALVGVQLRPN